MSLHAWEVAAILSAMFVVLMLDRYPSWLVFSGVLTIMVTLGLAPPSALLEGFATSGVMAVAALFPVAAGLYSTGAISILGQKLIGQPHTARAAQMRILPPVTLSSAFLNNTPLVAMMIPITRDVSRATGIAGSKLFMNLSFASILGGNLTLIGASTNLVIAGMIAEAIESGDLKNMRTLQFLDPFWLGAPVALVGVAFLVIASYRLLPDGRATEAPAPKRCYRSEFKVVADSLLDGKSLEESMFTRTNGYRLLLVARAGREIDQRGLILQGGDQLVFEAPAEILADLWTTLGLVPVYATAMHGERHHNRLVELVLSASAPAAGKRIADLPLPDMPYEMMLVGVSRNGSAPECPLRDFRIEGGDAAVVEVPDSFFYENRRERDFTMTKVLDDARLHRLDRAWIAAAITVAMVLLQVFSVMSVFQSALLAAGAMLLSGCISSEGLWRSIDWQIIVVLAASMGLEVAVTESGLSRVIAEGIGILGGNSPRIAIAVVLLGTILMTNLVANAAAAAIMFPVAVSVANRLEVAFMPFAIVLIIGASCAFINPDGFQTNLMVMKAGGYKFRDFGRLGLPLTAIIVVVVVVLAPLIYNF